MGYMFSASFSLIAVICDVRGNVSFLASCDVLLAPVPCSDRIVVRAEIDLQGSELSACVHETIDVGDAIHQRLATYRSKPRIPPVQLSAWLRR